MKERFPICGGSGARRLARPAAKGAKDETRRGQTAPRTGRAEDETRAEVWHGSSSARFCLCVFALGL
eukprot:11209379-Lingulodinium_polyedra.AAC.1